VAEISGENFDRESLIIQSIEFSEKLSPELRGWTEEEKLELRRNLLDSLKSQDQLQVQPQQFNGNFLIRQSIEILEKISPEFRGWTEEEKLELRRNLLDSLKSQDQVQVQNFDLQSCNANCDNMAARYFGSCKYVAKTGATVVCLGFAASYRLTCHQMCLATSRRMQNNA